MKIIQLIQRPQRRGAEIFAIQLSEQLIKSGHDVKVVSIFPGIGGLMFSSNWITLDRDYRQRLFDLKGWRKFAKLVTDWKPDLVQANAADTLKFATFSKKLFQWKFPIVYRNANQMGDFIRGRIHRTFNQFLLNSVNAVVSVSEASRRDFHQTFKFPQKKSQVIPIGIVPEEIDSKTKENQIKRNLPNFYLIQIGGLVHEKDPLGTLEIFSSLNNSELKLIFLGSGPLENVIRERINQLNLRNRVILVPNQPNIFPYLANAKALIMPSKIEGLPAVILEAMFLRIPVIAYNVGGISEVIGNNTGFLIPKNDPEEFKKGILKIVELSSDHLNDITSNGYKLVNNNFKIEEISKRFEQFYASIK